MTNEKTKLKCVICGKVKPKDELVLIPASPPYHADYACLQHPGVMEMNKTGKGREV
jgi:predicted RNA-binding protein YlxR (DUF448 family)